MITAHACSQSPALQVSGLQPGTAYHFRVQARNRPGCGPWCEVLPVHTKADVSEAPMSVVVARRTPGGFTVRWELPEEDNGSPIKTYRFDAHAPSSAAQPVCQSPHGASTAPARFLHCLPTANVLHCLPTACRDPLFPALP